MDLDRDQLQKDIHELYQREHAALGEAGTLQMLETARQWDLSATLSGGGVVVFPHAGVADCGHQIAAAVHACLDSGADRADAFHHGIGYGDPPEKSLPPQEGGLELARKTIEKGMEILGSGDYWGYNQHCVEAKSDARDAGQVFRYLRGPMRGQILDLTYSDAADLYKAPPPTWVAAALVEWQLDQ